jgi:dTMP kinase
LQLDAVAGLGRTRRRGTMDRMEQTNLAFHQQVQNGFYTLAAQHPDRIVPVPAEGSIEQVSRRIQTIVNQYLQRWYPSRLTA